MFRPSTYGSGSTSSTSSSSSCLLRLSRVCPLGKHASATCPYSVRPRGLLCQTCISGLLLVVPSTPERPPNAAGDSPRRSAFCSLVHTVIASRLRFLNLRPGMRRSLELAFLRPSLHTLPALLASSAGRGQESPVGSQRLSQCWPHGVFKSMFVKSLDERVTHKLCS